MYEYMKNYEIYRLKYRKYNVYQFERGKNLKEGESEIDIYIRYFVDICRDSFLAVLTFSSETSRDFRLLPTTRNSSSSSTIFLQNERTIYYKSRFILDSYLRMCFFSVNEWLVIVRILLYDTGNFKIV